MSARGWAGVLHYAADAAYNRCATRHLALCRCGEVSAAQLRELAALLDRITPEDVQRARWRAEREAELDARQWTELADILAALSRGPAEQQETGR